MTLIIIGIILCFKITFGEYSREELRDAGKRRYRGFNTKIDLLFNAYDDDNNTSDNKITLRVGLYDVEKRDRRAQNIEAFVSECLKLQEDLRLSRSRITFLREQEKYYVTLSEDDKINSLAYEKDINSSYIEKLFQIRERIFEEEYKLRLSENVLYEKVEGY